jgi:hypothetical protein
MSIGQSSFTPIDWMMKMTAGRGNLQLNMGTKSLERPGIPHMQNCYIIREKR